MRNQNLHNSFICLALVAMINSGCSTAPTGAASSTAEEQMLDLNRRYETGAISKEQYERESVEIHARRERELVAPGSPTNEAIRGMRIR
jgi:hypothetical protein